MPKSLTFESKYANRHVCNAAVGAQSGRHNRCPAVPEMVWRTLGAGETAKLGYRAGDEALIPLREQVLDWLFSDDYLGTFCKIHALRRFHASIDGNALWALLSLGLGDERAEG